MACQGIVPLSALLRSELGLRGMPHLTLLLLLLLQPFRNMLTHVTARRRSCNPYCEALPEKETQALFPCAVMTLCLNCLSRTFQRSFEAWKTDPDLLVRQMLLHHLRPVSAGVPRSLTNGMQQNGDPWSQKASATCFIPLCACAARPSPWGAVSSTKHTGNGGSDR